MDTSATNTQYRAPRRARKPSVIGRLFGKLLGKPENKALVPARKTTGRVDPPAGWVPPARSIMVIGSQRSGSTLLCALMRQTGVLGKPDEFFKKSPYDYWKIENDSTALRCELAKSLGSTPNGVCSMKVFSYHFERIHDHVALFDWFPNTTFVWIRRRDLLGQVLSTIIARQTGKYRSFYQDTGAQPEYDPADIALSLHRAALDEARWRTYLARTGLPVHEVYYEDLVADTPGVVKGIAGAVGIKVDVSGLSTQDSGLSTQRTSINDDWRARFLAEQGDPNFLHMDLCGRK